MRALQGPLRNRLMQGAPQRMPPGREMVDVPNSNMPVMDPGMMDPGMNQDGPYGMGNPGIDLPPGQGDAGMESMYPEPGQPQAMPVHDTGQASQFYQRMGKSVPAPMQGMTNAMEATPPGPLRSKLHAGQHQMMAGDQKSAISMKRMELSSKKQQLESVLQQIRRGEVMDQDGQMFKRIGAGIATIDSLLSQFPMEGQPGVQ